MCKANKLNKLFEKYSKNVKRNFKSVREIAGADAKSWLSKIF